MSDIFVAPTDSAWLQFHAQRGLELKAGAVNYWLPNGGNFVAIPQNGLFLFKDKYKRSVPGKIRGGGFLSKVISNLPLREAWSFFKEENGASTLAEFTRMVLGYRGGDMHTIKQKTITCLILSNVVLFSKNQSIEPPTDWSGPIVKGKRYSSQEGEGKRLYEEFIAKNQLQMASEGYKTQTSIEDSLQVMVPSRSRHGQSLFRYLVSQNYQGRCVISGEKSLPVLEAAHIKPYAHEPNFDTDNGLFLRSDIHQLYDAGYVTITPDHKFQVSSALEQQFGNGKIYYQLQKKIDFPAEESFVKPRPEHLDYHHNRIFLGT